MAVMSDAMLGRRCQEMCASWVHAEELLYAHPAAPHPPVKLGEKEERNSSGHHWAKNCKVYAEPVQEALFLELIK